MDGLEKQVEAISDAEIKEDSNPPYRLKFLGGFPRDQKFLDGHPLIKKLTDYCRSLGELGTELYNRFC